MRREWRERFPRHRLQIKPLVCDPGMYHDTCVTHVPWCMSGSLTCIGGENVPGIPGACATCHFTYLARGPLRHVFPIFSISWCLRQRRSESLRYLGPSLSGYTIAKTTDSSVDFRRPVTWISPLQSLVAGIIAANVCCPGPACGCSVFTWSWSVSAACSASNLCGVSTPDKRQIESVNTC